MSLSFETLISIATHCSNTMSDTDNVAPFLSQGDTLVMFEEEL